MKLTLHTLQGEELFECNVDVSSSQDWSLMADNKLSITFQLEHCVNLSPGSYVDYDGVRFYLLKEFKPTEIDSATWSYNLTLFDAASWMSVTVPVNLLDGKNNPTFVYTASLREHVGIIVDNLNRRMNTDQWKVGNIIDSSNITVKYDGRYCSAILQELVDDQNTEWWVDGMTLNIGRAEFGELIELGYGNGLLGNIVCAQADNMRSYAYLYPLGSTRNIDPTKYGYERLQLPNGQMYVDMSETGIAELVEERAFAGIFPRYEGAVTAVRSRAATSGNGAEFIIYYISDSDIPFNPNNYKMPGLVPNITFLSGELMGQDFEVNYDADAHEFEIITRWTSDNATQLPGGLLTPAVGDEYVVWNITMPDEYYPKAEQEFLEAAQKYADKAEKDISIYKANLDYIEVQERGLQLRPGQKVRLISSEYFPDKGYYDSRITRITRKLWYPDEVTIDVSAVRVIGSLSRIESSLSKAETRVSQLSVSIPAIIKSTDNSLPTDSSVYTSLRIDKEYLSRRKGGVMEGPLYIENTLASASWTGNKGMAFRPLQDGSFRGDIDEFHTKELFTDTFYIAGIPFRKMANGSLFIDANVVFGGGATLYGTDSTPAPSIFDGLPIDNETIYWDNGVLKAMGGSGGGGVADSVAWANVYGKPTWITDTKPTYNYSEIQGTPDLSVYALASAIPTNNNQLTNGAGYITASALNGYATQSWVNTALSGYFLTSNFTKANIKSTLGISDWALASSLEWGAINSKPTNIDGYGIVEYLTNLNNATLNKFFRSSFQASNRPAYNYAVGFTLGNGSASANYAAQLAIDYYGGVHTRYKTSTEWSEWVELAPLSSIPSLAGYATETFVNTALAGYLSLSGGTVNGNITATKFYGEEISTKLVSNNRRSYITNTGFSIVGTTITNWASGLSIRDADGNAMTTLIGAYGEANFTPSYIYIGGSRTAPIVKLDVATKDVIFNGSITAPSFIGNLTGNADSANELNGYAISYFMIFRNISETYVSAKLASSGLSKLAGEGYLEFWDSSGGWYNSKWGTVTAKNGFIGNLTGNADSATKLATSRKIWGQSFDGTGNILAGKGVGLMSTQNYYGLSILPDTSVYGVRTFLTYDEGSTMGAYEISASYAVGGLSIGVATGLEYNTTIIPSSASYTPIVAIKKNGNVVIGGTTANAKLHVYGNLLTEGGITMYSQRSLKNILSYEGLSLEQLSVIKPIKFTWKDGRDNRYHVGGVADDMATVVPEVVYSADDFLTMDYGNAGFYVAASLIKPVIHCYNKVEEHEKDIDYLKRENVAIKKENKALRDEINQLKQAS